MGVWLRLVKAAGMKCHSFFLSKSSLKAMFNMAGLYKIYKKQIVSRFALASLLFLLRLLLFYLQNNAIISFIFSNLSQYLQEVQNYKIKLIPDLNHSFLGSYPIDVARQYCDFLHQYLFQLQFDYQMNRRGINRSTERAIQQKYQNARISYERKCQTPSIQHQPQKKSKSKTKQPEKKLNNQSKQNRNSDFHIPHPSTITKKDSPFKHKNRPFSNLNNMRHARNLEHQLSNLNESAAYDSILQQSGKRAKVETVTHKAILQGKRFMKNNQFQKGLAIFSQCTQRDPNSLQAQYLMGVCAFHLQHYGQAIHYFGLLLEQEPQFRKNAYLFLSISYKKKQQHDQALHTLTEALEYYPKYFDALVLRAKILSKLHRFYDALQDINKSLKIQPGNPQSLIAKADSLRSLNQFPQAVKIYTGLLEIQWDAQVLLKRAIAHIENNCPNEALLDLNRLIQRSPNNSEAYLFKGLAFSKMKNFNQAILAYQQAIKFNSSKKATTKALYEVSKLKIEVGDYYGASYTLQRAATLEVDQKVIQKLRVFTEGATSIMKKKYKRGIQNMNYLAKKEHLNEQIRPLLYSFRAYAHFCQCKFLNALNDLNSLQKLGFSCDPASQYNLHLLTGISNAQNNNFNQALASFQQAERLRKEFSDPIIYKCLTKIGEYNRNPKTKDRRLLQEALRYIIQAIQQEDNYNSHYICSTLFYGLGRFQQSLQQIQKAIQKSDDHVIKHFYLRGLINGVMAKNKQAFIDFSNVLSLGKELKEKSELQEGQKEKQILQAYLNRAKCHLIFSQKKKAFQDLQTYISYKPLDSEIHTVAGRLLFSIGACEDAVKAYNYSPNIDKKKDELLERSKCYLALKQLNLCLKDLQKLIQLGDSLARYDYCCLSALKEASKGASQNFKEALRKITPAQGFNTQAGHIFTQADLCFYKGAFSFYLAQFSQARKFFIKSKNIKTVNKELQLLEEEDPDRFVPQLFENKIYTDAQVDYDIALCDLLLGDSDQAKKVLQKYQSFSLVFGKDEPNQPIDLTPFPASNRLCSIFSQIKYSQNELIRFRISFCLPKVTPPQIKFQIQPKIIEQLGMSSTEPRPDAPWIRRNVFGVVFTDQMVGVDIDIKTEKSLKKLDQIKIELEQDSPMIERGKLKDMFFLDAEVENKLAKLMEKNKKA